jgi:hypothetical protein
MARVSRANFTLLVSLCAYPVTWLVWGLALRRAGVKHGLGAALVLGPVSGHAAVAATEQAAQLWRTRTGFRRTLRYADDVPELLEQRDRLITTIERGLAATPVGPGAATSGS